MYQYIVMPVLRPFDEPEFVWGAEVIDFVNQTLEVIYFLLVAQTASFSPPWIGSRIHTRPTHSTPVREVNVTGRSLT